MTLRPPRLCPFRHVPSHLLPHLRCLSTSTSLPICLSLSILASPSRQAAGPIRVRAPSSLRCLSAVPGLSGSLEACGGGAPPSSYGCSRAHLRRKPVWKTYPRRRGCAGAGPRPAPGPGTMTAQRIRRYTHPGPSTQTRACTHSPAHPSPASRTRTGAQPTLVPRQQARAPQQPQALALGPTPPATPRHANTPPAPARARPAQPPPPPPRRPHLAALGDPLCADPSPPRLCSAPGPLRRDGPGPRRLRAASSRGHPGPREGDQREPLRSTSRSDAPPLSRLQDRHAHSRPRPLRRSLALIT